jgi:alanine dehydrogenase
MALLVKDEDVASLAPMGEIVDDLEIALADHARGSAPFYPRRINVRTRMKDNKARYALNTQVGGSAALNVMAVRLMSNMTSQVRRGEKRNAADEGHNHRNWGIIVLFDMTTSETLAVMPQFSMSGLRVGATTGLAAKYLARRDATRVGVFGTSKVARADLEGIAYARKLERVKVFSPNPDHRADFVADMSERLGIEVIAVDRPEEVVKDVDIINVATSSHHAVFDGDWLTPGQFVSTTKSMPLPRKSFDPKWEELYGLPMPAEGMEIDIKTLARADKIATLSREMILNENQRDVLDLIDNGTLSWDKFRELGSVIAGTVPGRERPEDLIVYKSSGGIGLQMAAVGLVVLRNARKRGMGMEIPGEWFSGDMSAWHAKGFTPTQ